MPHLVDRRSPRRLRGRDRRSRSRLSGATTASSPSSRSAEPGEAGCVRLSGLRPTSGLPPPRRPAPAAPAGRPGRPCRPPAARVSAIPDGHGPPERVVREPGGEQREGPIELAQQVALGMLDPVAIGRHRGPERRARDHLRKVVLRGGACARPHELGDGVGPLAVAEHRVPLQRRYRGDESHAEAEHRLLGLAVVVEGDDAVADHLHCRAGRIGGGQPRAQPLHVLVELAPDEVVLRAVVAEQGAPSDPGSRGDLVERRLLEAVGGEQFQRATRATSPREVRRGRPVRPSRGEPGWMTFGTECQILIEVTDCKSSAILGGESMPNQLTVEEPRTSGAATTAVIVPEANEQELVLEDLLVEDISIDGMCGVY